MTHRIYVKSTRLRDWDYTAASWYFVTICTLDRTPVLGEVLNGEMQLSLAGRVVSKEWLQAQDVRANVALDEFVVMPNHVHGIVVIQESPYHAALCVPPGRIYTATPPCEFARIYHGPIQIHLDQTYLDVRFPVVSLGNRASMITSFAVRRPWMPSGDTSGTTR